ncbi:MAG: signal recognition particle-docking protein FtsY, partial [Dehalococcoidia bacterium]|nr:signal recognition particle-docking protein FtsY [Dehalococcoidia bacterium]
IGAEVIAHQPGADPGAVVFDAIQAAKTRGAQTVIVDSAGRLQTKFNLMEELKKIRRVVQRADPTAPHETLLVLDANTGQNGVSQARYFTEAVGITGIILTKLDSTAKGGIVLAICDQLKIPVRFIGTGETVDDLAPFDPKSFVEAIMS